MSELAQEIIDRIDHELALEELSRLSQAERAQVAEWAKLVHLRWHRDNPHIILACCIYPLDQLRRLEGSHG